MKYKVNINQEKSRFGVTIIGTVITCLGFNTGVQFLGILLVIINIVNCIEIEVVK